MRSDRQRVGLSIDADGGVQEVEAPEPRKRNRQAVSGGTLLWSEEPGGAAVTLEDGQGREIWRVRTMIHIAADRLEWLCAQELPDGSFALGGRYLTGDGAVQEQAATMAVIGAGRRAARDCPDSVRRGRYARRLCARYGL